MVDTVVLTPTDQSIKGIDCYGDERHALAEYERFYNNPLLSDVTLVVGDELFSAHRIVLVKSSDVFERMLSQAWNGDTKKEVELIEDRLCVRVFPLFLRYLYNCCISLAYENALPILILADKYNVKSLKKVCLDYAVNHVIPNLPAKEVFHVWFQYGTKCNHTSLVNSCTKILARQFQEIITSPDWEKEWLSLDRDQLAECLKSNDLQVSNEYELFVAVLKWLQSPGQPERQGVAIERHLTVLVPLIRFPLMTPDELATVEKCPLVERNPKAFGPQIFTAYKFNSLPLCSRLGYKEFATSQFILRNYSELRWDKRLVINNFSAVPRYAELLLRVTTRASAVPFQNWDWELKVHPKGFSQNCDEFRVIMSSNLLLDQTRAVEYLLSLVDHNRIHRSVAGKKNFSKIRYSADLEMEKKLTIEELLAVDSPLLVEDNLCMQLTLRPID